MRRFCGTLSLLVGILLVGCMASPVAAWASAPAPPTLAVPLGLSIAEIKITGDEFLLLQNNTGQPIVASELSSWWLYGFNNVSPLSTGASGSQQQLPAVALGSGQTLLLSAAARSTCGAAVAGKLSVSLTDSGGYLELVRLSQDGSGTLQQTAGDAVSWSTGTTGQIHGVPSGTKDPQAVWYRYLDRETYGWQQAELSADNICQLNVTVQSQPVQPVNTLNLQSSNESPPATIISVVPTGADVPALPVHDIGLTSPEMSEILPNPDGVGNDDTDEFIEFYNSNDVAFDLSGFVLQTGTVTKHSYTFPDESGIPAKSFKAYYSTDTGLSLSNSGGTAALLDPLGNTVTQADGYGVAKDGQSWVVAKGKWYWTVQPTPGAANVVVQPTDGKSTAKSQSSAPVKSTTVKTGAATSSAGVTGKSANTATLSVVPIHVWTLAAVAALAVAYGVYEYRIDLANYLRKFRGNHEGRRRRRQEA